MVIDISLKFIIPIVLKLLRNYNKKVEVLKYINLEILGIAKKY